MADDIVTRLRDSHHGYYARFPRKLDIDAADEIERLRAEVERLQMIVADYAREVRGDA